MGEPKNLGVKTMIVALFKGEGDGAGDIYLYEVNEKEFMEELARIAPSIEEDWWDLAHIVEEHGKLKTVIKPDFSIYLSEMWVP